MGYTFAQFKAYSRAAAHLEGVRRESLMVAVRAAVWADAEKLKELMRHE